MNSQLCAHTTMTTLDLCVSCAVSRWYISPEQDFSENMKAMIDATSQLTN